MFVHLSGLLPYFQVLLYYPGMKAAPDDNIFSTGNIVTRLLTIPGFDSRLGEEFFFLSLYP
jgi:hypothetical protein